MLCGLVITSWLLNSHVNEKQFILIITIIVVIDHQPHHHHHHHHHHHCLAQN